MFCNLLAVTLIDNFLVSSILGEIYRELEIGELEPTTSNEYVSELNHIVLPLSSPAK